MNAPATLLFALILGCAAMALLMVCIGGGIAWLLTRFILLLRGRPE